MTINSILCIYKRYNDGVEENEAETGHFRSDTGANNREQTRLRRKSEDARHSFPPPSIISPPGSMSYK